MRLSAPMRFAASLLLCIALLSSAIADDEEMVSYPSLIKKIEPLEHEGSPSGNTVAGMFGALGVLLHNASLHSVWYTFTNPDGEEVGIEAAGTFSVGQCVLVHVRKANAQNTKLFPGVASLEPYGGCAK